MDTVGSVVGRVRGPRGTYRWTATGDFQHHYSSEPQHGRQKGSPTHCPCPTRLATGIRQARDNLMELGPTKPCIESSRPDAFWT